MTARKFLKCLKNKVHDIFLGPYEAFENISFQIFNYYLKKWQNSEIGRVFCSDWSFNPSINETSPELDKFELLKN